MRLKTKIRRALIPANRLLRAVPEARTIRQPGPGTRLPRPAADPALPAARAQQKLNRNIRVRRNKNIPTGLNS